jgi:hypothetical protein
VSLRGVQEGAASHSEWRSRIRRRAHAFYGAILAAGSRHIFLGHDAADPPGTCNFGRVITDRTAPIISGVTSPISRFRDPGDPGSAIRPRFRGRRRRPHRIHGVDWRYPGSATRPTAQPNPKSGATPPTAPHPSPAVRYPPTPRRRRPQPTAATGRNTADRTAPIASGAGAARRVPAPPVESRRRPQSAAPARRAPHPPAERRTRPQSAAPARRAPHPPAGYGRRHRRWSGQSGGSFAYQPSKSASRWVVPVETLRRRILPAVPTRTAARPARLPVPTSG